MHSDRGSQFRSNKFVKALRRHTLMGSMGRVCACADNPRDGVVDGFHEQTRTVSTLTSCVAETSGGWDRGGDLNVPGVAVVSEISADLSALIASYGALAQRDTGEFDQLGVNIEVQDAQDAQVCEVAQ
ncbi:hypothetical protein [Rathayibacter rathayi]|uniref:hypothetical protein n=1 Tax=Rathayibacter rathayi TaxID=33887 RepID=UPI000FDF9A3D|nr:hypothetical protein [Rathayibacter rathayi]AZZ48155.1 hypothetical protein C1O28_02190 [Rathayibacter rathayi]